MNVAENGAKYASVYESRKFYFCSAACKQQFEKNPQKYGK
jgi:YHS domain-containing protein